MTFLTHAMLLLLRGLVISAVLGLESGYSNDLSSHTSNAAIVATTGKVSHVGHTVAYYLRMFTSRLTFFQRIYRGMPCVVLYGN